MKEVAGNAGIPSGTRSLVCKKTSTRMSIHSEAPENTRHSPRDGLTVFHALFPAR
jgi:hypothetical protein